MSAASVRFSPTGTIQTYLVAVAGTYLIEAAGAQGGASASPGVKGGRVSGMFFLKKDDFLKIVAGSQGVLAAPPHHLRGGGGGSSMVWTGSSNLPEPIKLMLSARGGKGGKAAGEAVGSGGSQNPMMDLGEFNLTGGELDQRTADSLDTEWTRAKGSTASRTAIGKGQVDRGGYNAGAFRQSMSEIQEGDGYVSITPVSVTPTAGAKAQRPFHASTSASKEAKAPAPAGEPATASGSESTGYPEAAPDENPIHAPSQTILPEVTPRPSSWKKLLSRRRQP